MLYRIVIAIVLLSSFALWQGCGQSNFNDSEVNSAVTRADEDTTAPTISSIYPEDSSYCISLSSVIVVTFSETMNPKTITTNTSNTTCSGSLQVSSDSFISCIKMSSIIISNSNKDVKITPSVNLSELETYKIKITKVASDEAGNSLGKEYISETGFSTGVPNPTEDSSKPKITALSFSPSNINTTSSSESVTATISISDDYALPGAGYLNVEVRVRSPSNNQFKDFTGYTGNEESGGNTFCRTFKSTTTFPKGSESGTWNIEYASVKDNVGNNKRYTSSELTSRGFSTNIINTNPTEDSSKPKITALSFSPSNINTTSSSESVTATISISDDYALPGAGYLNVEVRVRSPSNNQFKDFTGYTGNEESGGNTFSRTFKSTTTFPQGSESGTWNIEYASVKDNVGNNKRYTSSELTSLGFSTTIINN